jgi:hypothetical protein
MKRRRTRARPNPTDASVRRMRVVVLELSDVDDSSSEVAETIFEWSQPRGVQWGYGSGERFSRDSYVSSPMAYDAAVVRLRQKVPSLRVHDVTGEFVFARTRCPTDYDGFGTITLAARTIVPEQGISRGRATIERFVAIAREYENWQMSRYGSGICASSVIAR